MAEVTRVYELPYPPTGNRAWRMVNGRMLISREGRRYRQCVAAILAAHGVRPIPGRLAMVVTVRPPDRRRRDLDNTQKGLLDALEAGGAYEDDSQIDLLVVRRESVTAGGQVHVRIERLPVRRCPLCGGVWDCAGN